MMKPLMIDLFTGLHGWALGGLVEGFRVVGVDIVDMSAATGQPKPDGEFQLVLQDVRTVVGRQFKDASLIVASPPCQEYSYMAMPWSRAKQIKEALRGKADFPDEYKGSRTTAELTALFDACFRIQREAIEAAGHFIPLVVENVRGAIPWVGRSRWNFGSFHLWGDVPALMPMTKAIKVPGFRFDGSGRSFQTASVEETGHKSQGLNWSNRELKGQDFTRVAGRQNKGTKNDGASWFNIAHNTTSGKGQNPDGRKNGGMSVAATGGAERGKWNGNAFPHELAGRKQPSISGMRNNGKGDAWFQDGAAQHGSKSSARKAASAAIAKIPFQLARHIARSWA